ncbi:hypothetical protein KY495_12655 [Massilia sp. PAMC28688]|uniref:hypothetical protein n=1 Tax=Massilia sp. PAMC28688 TaxID=2861283 RepID=UPI001C62A7DC|nr:hypothetical protein [Massilia sp. PAMC28688]QYF91657.1 hypothetical protein KY495_12655 [Massilia sp. PAMC28688]
MLKIRPAYTSAVMLLAALPALPAAQAQASSAPVRALEINNTAALKLADIERQIQQLQLAPAFTAAALSSPARIKEGQALVARLRDLSARRSAIAGSQASAISALRQSAPGAWQGIDSYLAQGAQVHQQLHTARAEVADAADAVLAWAGEQGAALRAENGRLRMDSPAQQQRFDQLFARLEAAMAQHERAVDASERYRKANQGRLQRQPIPSQY